MHGTKSGRDGKLYWTIADTGAHVTTREGRVIDNPDSGAVFRCNPDGTDMELFVTGLRNPQSLAWNDVGDLFTGDNNADGGDAARCSALSAPAAACLLGLASSPASCARAKGGSASSAATASGKVRFGVKARRLADAFHYVMFAPREASKW